MGGNGAGNPFGGGYQSGPFTWSYTSQSQPGAGGSPFGDFDINDPFEIFESFFGGGTGGARRSRYSLSVDFMDAVKGAEKKVTVEGKQRTIKIPPGANDGTRLRFDDFDVTIDVKPDRQFRRDGYDLFVDQEISFATAALGGEVEVPTIEGKLKMKVRAATPSHTLVRLRGEGVPHVQGRGKGDLYARLIVKVPEKLSREQKKALLEFQELEA